MFVRLAFVWCLSVFQHQPVASYRVNVKKLVDEKVEQVKAKSSSENVVEAEVEAVSSLVGEKVESATTWPRYYFHVGAGTLASTGCEGFFRTSQWRNLGANLSQVKHSLQRVCTDTFGCVGYHVHEGEGHDSFMTGAIILNARAVWPMQTPDYFLKLGAIRGWQGNGDSEAMNTDSKGSVACGLGWETGWQAYSWTFNSGGACDDWGGQNLIQDGGPSCTAWNQCTHVQRLGKVHNCRNWCAEHGLDCKTSWLMVVDRDEDGNLFDASCSTRETGDLTLLNAFFHMPFCFTGSDQDHFQKCECAPWFG